MARGPFISYSVVARATSIPCMILHIAQHLFLTLWWRARLQYHGAHIGQHLFLTHTTSIPWCSIGQHLILTLWWRARLQYHGVPYRPAFISYARDFNIKVFHRPAFNSYSDGARDFNIMQGVSRPAFISYSVVARATSISCMVFHGQHLFIEVARATTE